MKLDNGSPAQEVMFVSFFHLGGQHLCPSLMLSLPREKGYYWGALTRVKFYFPTILEKYSMVGKRMNNKH
jgi:hypothetical protein